MKNYRWDAEAYARNSSAQLAWARELIRKLALRGEERILDIGCGDGKVTADLAARVPRGQVTGVDNSEDMIRKVYSAFPAGSFPNLSFRCMDARSLSFTSEFDVAFSTAALHWVKDHAPMLSGVAAALKPGGRLLFQMGGRGNGEEIFSVLRDMIQEDPWRQYFQGFQFPWGFYGPEEYAGWLSAAGLSPSRMAYLHVDYRNITPIDEPLTAYGRITEIDGRKAFVTATMTAADGTLLTEANGLMVRLLPHQP